MITLEFSLGLALWQTFLILLLVLFVAALVDVLRSEFVENYKLIWILVILLVPIIGPILYFFIGRKHKK